MSLNVWIVNQYAVAPTQAGITRHYSLARELNARGHRATIIATSFDHLTRQETRLAAGENARLEEVAGVPFLWLRTPAYAGNSPARMWNLAVFARRVLAEVDGQRLPRPDVIVGSSPTPLGAFAAQQLARRHRVPFVLEVRDLWPQTLIDLGKMSPRHPVVAAFGLIERHLYRQADRIVLLLPAAADHVVAKGGARGKLVYLPNGIDLRLFPAPTPARREGPFTVMYAGAHGLANGLDSVLDTAALLMREGLPVRFRLVGDGPEKPRLAERARSEALPVAFDPPVPKGQVHGLLQEADAFIVTLRDVALYRHGISLNKLYDYLAAGRPTVFGANALNNPIAEAEAGIVTPPEDARAMADAVKRLVAMPPEARWEMGLRGRRYVAAHHDVGALGAQLEAVLHETVEAAVA